jgi:hypothetical protein
LVQIGLINSFDLDNFVDTDELVTRDLQLSTVENTPILDESFDEETFFKSVFPEKESQEPQSVSTKHFIYKYLFTSIYLQAEKT